MAYADFEFYTDSYFGDVLTADNAARWLTRASDTLDTLTHGRLISAFPTIEAHVEKVKKAVCAVAEALVYVDVQRQAASAQKAADGSYRGAVASVSSGRESISYASNGNSGTVYAAAAADADALQAVLWDAAARYIANIPDANGINLLYAGGDRCVSRHHHCF